MFDSKQTLTERLSDAVDLAIDFATLGEYGLEPVEDPSKACEARRAHLSQIYSLRCRETSCITPELSKLRNSRRETPRKRGSQTAKSGPRQRTA